MRCATLWACGLICLILSAVSCDSSPESTSDDRIIEAFCGADELDYYHKLKRTDRWKYEQDLDNMRDQIIRSGATVDEFARAKRAQESKEALIQTKVAPFMDQAEKDAQSEKEKLRVSYEQKAEGLKEQRRTLSDQIVELEQKIYGAHSRGFSDVQVNQFKSEQDRLKQRRDQIGNAISAAEEEYRRLCEKVEQTTQRKIEAYRQQVLQSPLVE